MRIIDAHVHLLAEPGYLDGLLRVMDACGIERCALSGLGPLFGHADNAAVRRAFAAHPDRVIGQVFVRPGVDTPELIDWAAGAGFRMVKVTIPRKAYDDPAFFPLWERAQAHRMPVLFHTGVVTTGADDRGQGISSWFMQPMQLEPITREFPELRIIVAHLGIHWNTDAAELARMRRHVYVDLTGEPHGWLRRVDAEGLDRYLWWPDAFAKIVFGTDVHHSKIRQILDEDLARVERFNLPPATRQRIFADNLLEMLGLAA